MEEDVEQVDSRPASVRRSFTIRNNAARQVAVNFMPSRQLPYNTIRLRRSHSEHNALLEEAIDMPDAVDKQVDIIVREMEQHDRLMEDNEVSEGLRREALRDLPQGLTMKRNVRAKLSASVTLRSTRKPISMFRRLKYRISFAWQRFRGRLRDFIFSIELWYEAIRNIEGHFGSAVGSYFYLLRWLFVLNLALTVFVVSFTLVPQALYINRTNATVHRKFADLVAGTGGFEDSLLFYGHYHPGDVSTHLKYNMPFAYFFTMACLYIAAFAVLCYRTAYSYRRNFIETAGGVTHVFANKVFCGWDFGIVTPHAAALNATSLYNEFKELLYEQNKKRVVVSPCVVLARWVCNTCVWCVWCALTAGLLAAVWVLRAAPPHPALPPAIWHILVSLVITIVATVCPLIYTIIAKCEYYKPRTAVYVTLARTWILDIATLTLLVFYWTKSNTHCWETSFGQEMYRLILLDSLISLFFLPFIEFTRGLYFKLNKSSSPPEFNIAYNSLILIYNQAVVSYGLLFSPPLVVAVTIKFLLLFYVKRECALRACQPARKVWRAAQTQTIMFMLVTLSLFVALFTLGTLFVSGESRECGPFVWYESVFSVVTEGVLGLSAHPLPRALLAFLVRPGVIAFLALALCVGVYYMRARARAQHGMVKLLRHMLVLQAKDKEFLLTAIAKVSNGEWLYNPKPEDYQGPDSHTWKYLNEVRRPSNANFHFDASRLNHSVIEGRPRSYVKDNRPNSSYHADRSKTNEDGDTDSSFSWQGSSNYLNQKGEASGGGKKWI